MSFLRRQESRIFKITHKGQYFYGGPFDTEIEAAKARDKKAIELFGEFAWLNFPPETGGQRADIGRTGGRIDNRVLTTSDCLAAAETVFPFTDDRQQYIIDK